MTAMTVHLLQTNAIGKVEVARSAAELVKPQSVKGKSITAFHKRGNQFEAILTSPYGAILQGKNDSQWTASFPKHCCCDSRPCYSRPTMPSGSVMRAWGDVISASSSFLCASAILSFFLSSIFRRARSFFFKSFLPS